MSGTKDQRSVKPNPPSDPEIYKCRELLGIHECESMFTRNYLQYNDVYVCRDGTKSDRWFVLTKAHAWFKLAVPEVLAEKCGVKASLEYCEGTKNIAYNPMTLLEDEGSYARHI